MDREKETLYFISEAAGALPNEAIAEAAHYLYCTGFAELLEEKEWQGISGQDLCEITPRCDLAYTLPTTMYMLGGIEAAWGTPIFRVFTEMGIPQDQWEANLCRLLYNCMGSGVSIEDDYSTFHEVAEALDLRMKSSAPIRFEGHTFREIADSMWSQGARPTVGYPSDDDEEWDGSPFTPHEAWLYAAQWGSYMNGSDPGACMYGFDEHGLVQSEAHRAECLKYIEGCIADVEANPENFDSNELAKLDALSKYLTSAPVAA